MQHILNLSARAMVQHMARRDFSAEALVRACLERIEAHEPHVRAWQFLDPALALAQARRLDAGAATGALHGLPIGVKDLMDTADMPTGYGSPIYAGYRPRTDAACVAASRAAGAIVMGKTVSTEFATYRPGATANPRAPLDAPRTPGGSSSGSAAAVAAGMVPLAFASQTAGSIVRPAAYCGIVGYKPTHGTLALAGIKSLAPSLDTVGVLARSVDDAAFFVGILARLQLLPDAVVPTRLRVGICHTPHWARASNAARQSLADAAQLLEQAGATVCDLALPAPCDGLTAAQIDIMGFEASLAFAPEVHASPEALSAEFTALLALGRAVDGSRYVAAQRLADRARQSFEALFATVDIVLAPSTEGEAPAGLGATGDPIFNRLWTLLGNPCVHVPLGTGPAGMPLGVTLIGPRYGDAQTLTAASTLERCASDFFDRSVA
ncbi:MAG: Asp-tRNA(Asn)/Glu-tRNA(Gln) amidotransferase A subunit family amidase [Janthinobacterium sp.]|jgi:Asp-tRNA(Asn)/Glu-tRNA(Gln) amidotransferase A subunit family amidase